MKRVDGKGMAGEKKYRQGKGDERGKVRRDISLLEE